MLDWMDGALCAQTDPELFFSPHRATGGGAVRTAKVICRACPVREQCLGYALQDPTLLGIWGGTTAAERSRLRRGTRRLGSPANPARRVA